MAHSGYYYPLHFRRDMTQNVTIGNRGGFAKQYQIVSLFGRGVPWTAGFPVPYLSDGGVAGVNPMLVFTWPNVAFNGHMWRKVITIQEPQRPPIFQNQMDEWFIDGVVQYRALWDCQSFTDFGKIPYGVVGATPINNLPAFGIDPNDVPIAIAVHWDGPVI